MITDPRPTAPDTPIAASVNRTRIVELPGVSLDDAVRGKQAYHLLSAPALIRYAQQAADALRMPEAYREADPAAPKTRQTLPRYVDACLDAENPSVREAADAIARRLGRNLGYLAVALHRGDPVNRAARADWPGAAWETWRAIRTYRIDGGVMSGRLGERLIDHGRQLLTETGYDDVLTLAATPRPRNMGLLGVGRYMPPTAASALCLDLGQTSVKRAFLRYRDGTLSELHWFKPVPVHWAWRNQPDAAETIAGERVLAFTADAIASALKAAGAEGLQLSKEVGMSIAAYVRGDTLLGHGLYARMSECSDDARALIADAVEARSGLHIRPILIHDGTAAAALHAGETDTAVLVIGTAIGVGFAPNSATGLRPLASGLKVREQQAQNKARRSA